MALGVYRTNAMLVNRHGGTNRRHTVEQNNHQRQDDWLGLRGHARHLSIS